jgi:hypothetical protein
MRGNASSHQQATYQRATRARRALTPSPVVRGRVQSQPPTDLGAADATLGLLPQTGTLDQRENIGVGAQLSMTLPPIRTRLPSFTPTARTRTDV